MTLEEYAYLDTLHRRGGGIPRVYVGAPYQRGHGIGSFLGGLFRKVLPFLHRGARAVSKEALRAGINVIEDVENDVPLKEALKSRFKESRTNLKRKAKEKITNLMTGSGYKVDAKIPALQFPFSPHDSRLVTRKRRRRSQRRGSKKTSTRKSSSGRRKKSTSATRRPRKKKTRTSGRSGKKSSVARRKRSSVGKKRSVADIFS